MTMRDRIDPLIAERAPWMFSDRRGTGAARAVLERLLGYPRTLELAEHYRARPNADIMDGMARLLAHDLKVTGLENVPREGPALIVANHPTGIADGIMLWSILSPMRPDMFVYANSDILRVLPQMETMILPVEWRPEKRSVSKTRETMALTRRAIDAGRLGVIFPAGRLAKRRGLRLHERDWMPSAAMIARKYDLPVIPINIRSRNSVLFYLFDLIHPTMRDITLFHEMLNKDRQPYRISVGRPIPAASLPTKSEHGIEALRDATLALGGRHAPTVSLVDVTRRPGWARALAPGA